MDAISGFSSVSAIQQAQIDNLEAKNQYGSKVLAKTQEIAQQEGQAAVQLIEASVGIMVDTKA